MTGLVYRVRQVVRALRAAPLTHEEYARVRSVLNDEGFALYQSMPLADQRHSLKIFDSLRAQGHTARPLLEAALLHDVAKRNVGLVYRAGVVVLKKISPPLFSRAANPTPPSWRYPFHISLHHPELGAALAARAGIEENACALIRAHQETLPVFEGAEAAQLCDWHRALQALDDVN
jgi:hypothetical protein